MSDRFRRLELREAEVTRAEHAATTVGTPLRTAADDLEHAVAAVRQGRFEPALRLYTRALRDDRGLIRAWVGQVQMLVLLGECDEARLWSDKALELFRDNGELLAVKAQACARLGDTRAAMACSDASLRSPGSSAARWQARGEVLLANDARRARDCFEKSLAEADTGWFDRVAVALVYLYHQKATAALEFAQAAVELSPAQAFAWSVRGQCQEALGWCAQAATSYEQCLELAPDDQAVRAALGALQTRTPVQHVLEWVKGLLTR